MVMDARWKVYVQDRRFDDNQISNVYLKLKWETVGRFSFDFRPMDGDESYMVANNTLRIFWGDLHKLDGVIQRVDWDSTQWCYHIYGADIRGLLLERVNTEPATVHSYTSDIQTQVMFNGCDFPTNVWTGSGENIGRYTFNYRVGIQNTVRVMSPTIRWENVIERGTVYEHQNGCLYDATKNWAIGELVGATLRFVSGACKNSVYNINGNTTNKVCIRLPGESPPDNESEFATQKVVDGIVYKQVLGSNMGFESGTTDPWVVQEKNSVTTVTTDAHQGSYAVYHFGYAGPVHERNELHISYYYDTSFKIEPYEKYECSTWIKSTTGFQVLQFIGDIFVNFYNIPPCDWTQYSTVVTNGPATLYFSKTYDYLIVRAFAETSPSLPDPAFDVWIDGIQFWVVTTDAYTGDATGTIPGCSRIGDIYEIVTHKMTEVQPPSLSPATLEQDNHIIRYNLVDDQSDHTTSMTVRGNT